MHFLTQYGIIILNDKTDFCQHAFSICRYARLGKTHKKKLLNATNSKLDWLCKIHIYLE